MVVLQETRTSCILFCNLLEVYIGILDSVVLLQKKSVL